MEILRNWVIPAVIICLVFVMIASWIINCTQANSKNRKKQSALPNLIVLITGIVVIIFALMVKIGLVDRIFGGPDDSNAMPQTTSIPEKAPNDLNNANPDRESPDASGAEQYNKSNTEVGLPDEPVVGDTGNSGTYQTESDNGNINSSQSTENSRNTDRSSSMNVNGAYGDVSGSTRP